MKITNVIMLMAFLANVAVLSGCGKKTCNAANANLETVCKAQAIGTCQKIPGCSSNTGASSCAYNHDDAVKEAKTKCASLAEDKCTHKVSNVETCKAE